MKARLWQVLMPVVLILGGHAIAADHAYTLSNGMRLYVVEDHRAPVVLSSLWYRAGSSDEVGGKTGIAHMLEHLMFRGTTKNPDGSFMKKVSAAGGQLNAMTTKDFTMYHEYVKRDQLPLVLSLEADRMTHLTLSPTHFNEEKQVVIEERRMRVDDKPSAMAQERLTALALVNNPYHHPVIGWPTDMQHYQLADAKAWYKTWYHPNNAYLVIVGDVQAEKVRQLVQHYFGSIPKVSLPVRKPRKEIEPLGLKRGLVKLPAKVPQVSMAYFVPTLTNAPHRWIPYALTVLSAIMSSDEASRLPRVLVREKHVASGVGSTYQPYQRYQDLFEIHATPSVGGSLSVLEQAIDEEVEHLQRRDVSRAELKRIKAQVIAGSVYQQDSLSQRAMNVGVPVACGLPWQTDSHWVSRIQAVTAKQIRWVASHYLKKDRLSVIYLEPTGRHPLKR